MKIRVTFEYPPIPVRTMDYIAFDDDRLDGAPDAGPKSQRQGYGATRIEALRDLAELAIDDYSDAQMQDGEAKALRGGDTTTLLFIEHLRSLHRTFA